MTHIEQRYDTPAAWAAANPVLNNGEVGWEKGTGKGKIGDGATAWNALPYFVQPGTPGAVLSVAGRTGNVVLANSDVSGSAPLLSPALTGTPTAPTAASTDSSTRLATTAHVKSVLSTSPALGGTPTAPTQAVAANGDSIATTKFVKDQAYAPLASPALSGAPTTPTQSAGDNSTRIATTAFVTAAIAAYGITSDVGPTATDANVTAVVARVYRRGPMATLVMEFTLGIGWSNTYPIVTFPVGYRPVVRVPVTSLNENAPTASWDFFYGIDGILRSQAAPPAGGTFRFAVTFPRA